MYNDGLVTVDLQHHTNNADQYGTLVSKLSLLIAFVIVRVIIIKIHSINSHCLWWHHFSTDCSRNGIYCTVKKNRPIFVCVFTAISRIKICERSFGKQNLQLLGGTLSFTPLNRTLLFGPNFSRPLLSPTLGSPDVSRVIGITALESWGSPFALKSADG